MGTKAKEGRNKDKKLLFVPQNEKEEIEVKVELVTLICRDKVDNLIM